MENDFEKVVTTLRAMRRMSDQAVADFDLRWIVEMATLAPNAQNAQQWRFVVVTDPGVKRKIGEAYCRLADTAIRPMLEATDVDESQRKVYGHALEFAQRFADVPAMIFCCMAAPRPTDAAWLSSYYGSVFPAIQNLMLAARARGLASVLTTTHLLDESAFKAVLDIPAEVNIEAIVPVGYPLGEWKRPRRKPVDDVLFVNGWRH